MTRQPLLYAALAMSGGIVIGSLAWRPPTWWLVAAIAFAGASMYFARNRSLLGRSVALGTWALVGALSIQLRPQTPVADIARFLDGIDVVLTGHVVSDGKLRQAGFGGLQQSVEIITERVTTDTESTAMQFGVRLNIYAKKNETGHGRMGVFRYGERLQVSTKLRWPRNYRNPGAFDYVGYLADRGIIVQGSARLQDVELLPGLTGGALNFWRARMTRSILQQTEALWPSAETALMNAMVIGNDAFINRDTRADFQRSGTYHILVVSGMNVGILAFILFWILRRLRTSEVLASVIVVLFSVAYAFLTDVGPPIWRATLMLAIYLGVRLLYRDRCMLNAIGGAALGLLLLDPKALLGASFQLTFLSVLIIGAVGVPIIERTSGRYRQGLCHLHSTSFDAELPPRMAQFRVDLRMIAGRVARFAGGRIFLPGLRLLILAMLAAYETLLISGLMQVGLALPMAWYFHRAAVMGLPANLLVIPLTGILMPAAVAALLLSYLSLPLARLPAHVAGLAVQGITSTVHWVGRLEVADLRVPAPSTLAAVAAAIAIAAAMLLSRRRPAYACAGLAALAATAFWIALVPPRPDFKPGVLEVTAIDVGQADSTLLVTPDGKAILVDAGGPLGGMRSEFDTGEDVVAPYLWSRHISRLHAVVVTHAHSDHMGGMAAILRDFRPRELWIGSRPASGAFSALLQEASEYGVRIVQRQAGDRFEIGSTSVEVLWPPPDWQIGQEPSNDDSLALRFAYGNSAVLLEGDAGKKIEATVAEQGRRAELLKVGHNGSLTSTTPELLAALQPRWAVISVGAHNSFGHPRREILERLWRAGVKVYRTDLDGAVTLYLDGRGPSPSAAVLP